MAGLDWKRRRVFADPRAWLFLLASFEGRIPRLPFWVAAAALAAAAYAGERLADALGGPPAAALAALVFLYPALALSAKRAHDRGRSELYLLFFFLPALLVSLLQVLGYVGAGGPMGPALSLLGLWMLAAMILLLVDLGLMRGQQGPNRFGPDPLD